MKPRAAATDRKNHLSVVKTRKNRAGKPDISPDISNLIILLIEAPSRALISWQGDVSKILGLKSEKITSLNDILFKHIHSEDQFETVGTFEQTVESSNERKIVYRWIRPDSGEILYLSCRISPYINGSHELVQCIVSDVSTEVTSLLDSDHSILRLAPFLNMFGEVAILIDRDLQIKAVHPAAVPPGIFAEFFDEKNCLAGRDLSLLLSGHVGSEWTKKINQILSGTDPLSIKIEWQNHERWFRASFRTLIKNEVPEAVLITVENISREKRGTDAVKQVRYLDSSRTIDTHIVDRVRKNLLSLRHIESLLLHHKHPPFLLVQTAEHFAHVSNESSELLEVISGNSGYIANMEINSAVSVAIRQVMQELPSDVELGLFLGPTTGIGLGPAAFHQLGSLLSVLVTAQCRINSVKVRTGFISLGDKNTPASYAITLAVEGDDLENLRATEQYKTEVNKAENAGLIVVHEKIDATRFSLHLVCSHMPVAEPLRRPPATQKHEQLLVLDPDPLSQHLAVETSERLNLQVVSCQTPAEVINRIMSKSGRIGFILLDAETTDLAPHFIRRFRRLAPFAHIMVLSSNKSSLPALMNAGAIVAMNKPLEAVALENAIRSLRQLRNLQPNE